MYGLNHFNYLALRLYLCSEGWTIAGTPVDLQDPRLLAVAGSERHLLEADYDEYADSSASGAAFCRFATLIVTNTFPTSLIFALSVALSVLFVINILSWIFRNSIFNYIIILKLEFSHLFFQEKNELQALLRYFFNS